MKGRGSLLFCTLACFARSGLDLGALVCQILSRCAPEFCGIDFQSLPPALQRGVGEEGQSDRLRKDLICGH